jgi:hypothetical protein
MPDRIEIHNALSPIVTKLELLVQLPPIMDTAGRYCACSSVILDMVGDYVKELRRTLDAFVDEYAREH